MRKLVLVLLVFSHFTFAENYALLVGVSDYESPIITDLDGPKYDVLAFQKILPSWGFKASNTAILIDDMATKSNILASLRAINIKAKHGDNVFLYMSGHGTSPFDYDVGIRMPHSTGAFMPYDSHLSPDHQRTLNSLVVGATDLLPTLKQLDQKSQVFVVVDACYSENTARSISSITDQTPASRAQSLPFSMASTDFSNDAPAHDIESSVYPYNNIVFFAASAKNEVAGDYHKGMRSRTFDGNPHGVFSDALLRVLNGMVPADANSDGQLSYLEAYRAANDYLLTQPQSPKLSYQQGNTVIETGVFSTQVNELLASINTNDSLVKLNVYFEGNVSSLFERLSAKDKFNIVNKKHLADIVFVRSQKGLTVMNRSGEEIKEITMSSASFLNDYLAAQHWIKNVQKINGLGGFSTLIDLTTPEHSSTVAMGEEFGITIMADKTAKHFLFTMDSNGKISTLYPYNSAELTPKPQGAFTPFEGIRVGGPLGEDWLISLAVPRGNTVFDKFMKTEFDAASNTASELLNLMLAQRSAFAKDQLRLVTVE